MILNKLPRKFYERDAAVVAEELLGKYLVRIWRGRQLVGRIVEVEAYLGPHDLASHSSKKMTPRTQVMFGPPGHAYVYMIYGMYHCMNVVTGPEGHAAAVLLRALEPVENIEDRTGGPGLLCRAMHIDRDLNAHDLASDDFHLSADSREDPPAEIARRPRVGVHYAGKWALEPLRFYVKGSRFVSRK